MLPETDGWVLYGWSSTADSGHFMRLIGLVAGLVLVWATVARADEPAPPQQCKASADCGNNAVCTAEGKCVQLPPPATPPPESPPKPPGPSDADIESGKLHFEQGITLFNKGDFAGALAEFTASYKVNPLPFILKNIGLAQQKLFQYVEAMGTLQRYVNQNPDAADVAETKQVIADIRALLVEIKLVVTPIKDVVIKVDGKEVGKTPLEKPLLVAAGTRSLELSLDGYEPQKRDLMVATGVPIDLKFDLKLIPKTGKVRINSPVPRATVSIDGQPRGLVPIELELSGGGHQIEVVAPDHQTHRGELTVTVGQTRELNITLDKVVVAKVGKPWYKKWYVVAPIGAVVVGGGIGTYLIVTGTPDPIAGTLAPGAGKIQ